MDGPLTARGLQRLPDGTVKQVSPITGTVVWTVPGRSDRPLPSALPPARPLPTSGRDAACAFCPDRYLETPPEKARLLLDLHAPAGPAWRIERHLPAGRLDRTVADFRRIPNLFEILPLDYWRANHGYQVPDEVAARARAYVGSVEGRAHVLAIKRARMRAAGATPAQAAAEPEEALLARSLTLFASTHDVIVARRHFVDGATHDDQLCSAGDLTPDEHHAFVALTLDALADLEGANPFVQYVSVFQNWLRPAGASFDHLHKQLVAIDEVGPLMTRVVGLLREDPHLFTTAVLAPAAREGLLIAGNEHAVAVAGVGHRYPTIEILATSSQGRPWELPGAAVRGMSDLLHACHAATSRLVPTNEEWHYRPRDVEVAMPWRVNLKWRISTLAGFEGGTKINVNTISPSVLRERMVAALLRLRSEGLVADVSIGHELRDWIPST